MFTTNTNFTFKQNVDFVADHPETNSNAVQTFTYLYHQIKDRGYSSQNNTTLARKVKISERTIARCLNVLERLGFITREGLGYNRRVLLGAACKLTSRIYHKIKQVKKNLTNSARKIAGLSHNGKYIKITSNNNNRFSVTELCQIRWYENNPHVKVSEEDLYLFT